MADMLLRLNVGLAIFTIRMRGPVPRVGEFVACPLTGVVEDQPLRLDPLVRRVTDVAYHRERTGDLHLLVPHVDLAHVPLDRLMVEQHREEVRNG